jgi:hypothetical protein
MAKAGGIEGRIRYIAGSNRMYNWRPDVQMIPKG